MKGEKTMTTCLDFAVRHRVTSLHLCFEIGNVAAQALKGFARDIEAACEDEVIFIQSISSGHERCVGFLKRDFICVEKYSFNDEDDGDAAVPPDAEESDEPQGSGGGRAVDAATMILKAKATKGD